MKPVVVQHSFGDPGTGGPIAALDRLLASRLADEYTFVRMHQHDAAGGLNLKLIRQWCRTLRVIQPDIVHVRGLGNEGFHGALAARLAGCQEILVSIHGTVRDLVAPPNAVRRWALATIFEPATLRMATEIVAVCDAMSDRDFLDPVRARVRSAVANGVRLPEVGSSSTRMVRRAELGISPDQVALVSVGRLSVEKGHLDLAQALAQCGPELCKRLVLLVIGDGPDREAIFAAYSAVPYLDVRELGRRHDVVDLLAAGDVFVFPTLHENLSNALLEAMAAGLPVVATAVGGNAEVLANGGGVLVGPGDRGALASAITRLTRDESHRQELGARAREVVASHYTLEHMVAGWDRCYQAILSKGRTP